MIIRRTQSGDFDIGIGSLDQASGLREQHGTKTVRCCSRSPIPIAVPSGRETDRPSNSVDIADHVSNDHLLEYQQGKTMKTKPNLTPALNTNTNTDTTTAHGHAPVGRLVAPNVRSWASEIDDGALRQAIASSKLPILAGPVALMPDAHLGYGVTVGSVLATDGAIIPSAVGVDVGCGMLAGLTTLTASDLPDSLEPLLHSISRSVPAGMGQGHRESTISANGWFAANGMPDHFTDRQRINTLTVWVTRKGAIRAFKGDLGIIPGSMGTDTYVVEGLGNPLSWCSCSHGAGRRMSRTQAKKQLTAASLTKAMGTRAWLVKDAAKLVDEHPAAYKSIEAVMADQVDLVRPKHRLTAVLNYKG